MVDAVNPNSTDPCVDGVRNASPLYEVRKREEEEEEEEERGGGGGEEGGGRFYLAPFLTTYLTPFHSSILHSRTHPSHTHPSSFFLTDGAKPGPYRATPPPWCYEHTSSWRVRHCQPSGKNEERRMKNEERRISTHPCL
jgi:hypothetical protein